MGMTARIKVRGFTLKASLYDNAAGRKLWNSMPVTYQMMNLYGREMCCRVGRDSFPAADARRCGYSPGDISFWPLAGSLLILYKQDGEEFVQQPVGRIEGDLSFLEEMPDTVVEFERDE